MNDRERMQTVSLGGGSKEELFEKGHPVIRELRTIPEIIFEEEIPKLPSSAIPMKTLFARKQMNHFHVDSLILKRIALQTLHILTALSEKNIYPGLISLEDLYVDMDNSRYGVFLLHPEKFQLLEFEQDYEWYPEDERIFAGQELFNAKTQKIADNRLLYKILVASARGNVKVPPVKTETDYSELFFHALPVEWRQIFEKRQVLDYRELKNMLEESIEMEEEFARQTKENIDERSRKMGEEKIKRFQEQKEEGQEEQFDLFIILRTEVDNSRKISRLLYLLQDELETENHLAGHSCQQAFVFGNGAVQVRPFAVRRPGFRCQFPQTVREYSAGEALIIGADLMEEKLKKLYCGKGKKGQEFRIYILLDGRIKNDRLFQVGLKRLESLRQEGVKMQMCAAEDVYCEACQKLHNVVEG